LQILTPHRLKPALLPAGMGTLFASFRIEWPCDKSCGSCVEQLTHILERST
jgi:bacterioferritin-associated ferredoxin